MNLALRGRAAGSAGRTSTRRHDCSLLTGNGYVSPTCEGQRVSRRRSRKREPTHPIPDRYTGPPTVISLEWDYSYESVLANRSPGAWGVDLLDPAELGLSQGLAERLAGWLDRQEALSGR